MADDTIYSRKDLEARLVERALKDEAFAEELRTDPRAAVEREIGPLPEGMEVKVLQEDAKTFYLILPPPPQDAGELVLSEEELYAIAGGFNRESVDWCCSCTGTNWPKTH